MFNILYLRIFFLLVFCAIAAYTDYKTGYIYDWTNYLLIGIALILNIFTFSLVQNINVIITAMLIYFIGYIIYYFGKIGGGDIKLFIGIHMILPYYFQELFILYVLIASSLLCVIFVSIKYFWKIFPKIDFNKEFFKSKRSKIIRSLLLFLFFVFLLYYSITTTNLPSILYLSILPIFLGLLTVIFEDEIKEYIYLEYRNIKDLEEGDVIAIKHLSKSKLKKLNLNNRQVLEKEDIKSFKKKKIKKLPIYYNLPRFGPYILLGVGFTLIMFLII